MTAGSNIVDKIIADSMKLQSFDLSKFQYPKTIDEIPAILQEEKSWFLVLGHWGDFIMYVINAHIQGHDVSNILFLGYGPNNDLHSFINAQPFVKRVCYYKVDDIIEKFETDEDKFNYGFEEGFWESFYAFMKHPNITHIDYKVKAKVLYPNFQLPYYSKHFSYKFKQMCNNYIVIFPYSKSSPKKMSKNDTQEAWEHWEELMEFLITSYPYISFVLVGEKWDSSYYSKYPNVINLVDKTPSVTFMYALAEQAICVISTTNSLWLWSAIKRKKHIIIENTGANRWIKNMFPNTKWYFANVFELPDVKKMIKVMVDNLLKSR